MHNNYYCIASHVVHCSTTHHRQCSYCKWYEAGNGGPHYSVPAIPLTVDYSFGWEPHEQDYIFIEEWSGNNSKLVFVREY